MRKCDIEFNIDRNNINTVYIFRIFCCCFRTPGCPRVDRTNWNINNSNLSRYYEIIITFKHNFVKFFFFLPEATTAPNVEGGGGRNDNRREGILCDTFLAQPFQEDKNLRSAELRVKKAERRGALLTGVRPKERRDTSPAPPRIATYPARRPKK